MQRKMGKITKSPFGGIERFILAPRLRAFLRHLMFIECNNFWIFLFASILVMFISVETLMFGPYHVERNQTILPGLIWGWRWRGFLEAATSKCVYIKFWNEITRNNATTNTNIYSKTIKTTLQCTLAHV